MTRQTRSLLALVWLAACSYHPTVPVSPGGDAVAAEVFTQGLDTSVSLLIAVDNSGSMAEEQSNLMANLATLLSAVEANGAGLRVAVITSDPRVNPEGLFVGVPIEDAPNPRNRNLPVSLFHPDGRLKRALPDDSGVRAVPFCQRVVEAASVDGGVLDISSPALRAAIREFPRIPDFMGRTRGRFVDEHFENGDSGPDGIADENVEPSFLDAVGCFLSVGVDGFGFESPLGQLAAALDAESLESTNGALLGDPDSVLALVLLSDEDDCSRGGLVAPGAFVSSGEALGTSLQCALPAALRDCEGNPGVFDSLLPVQEVASQLAALRPAARTLVASIAGPPDSVSFDCSVDARSPAPSCSSAEGRATPGNRLAEFATLFPHHITPEEAEICGAFGPIVSQIADELDRLLSLRCLHAPIDLASFDEDRDLRVEVDLREAEGPASCASLGEGVARAAGERQCVLDNQFTQVVADPETCLPNGAVQGLAVQIDPAVQLPRGALLQIAYVAQVAPR